jgi:hypothetical protein
MPRAAFSSSTYYKEFSGISLKLTGSIYFALVGIYNLNMNKLGLSCAKLRTIWG